MEVNGHIQAPADLPSENPPPPDCRWIQGLKGPFRHTSNTQFEILGLCHVVLSFMFITLLTTARHSSLFWATWVQSMLSHSITSRFIFNIIFRPAPRISKRFIFRFPHHAFSKFPFSVTRATCSARFILFHLFTRITLGQKKKSWKKNKTPYNITSKGNSSNAAQVRILISHCRIHCDKSGTVINLTQTISVFSCQYQPNNAPYSYSLVYNRHSSLKHCKHL